MRSEFRLTSGVDACSDPLVMESVKSVCSEWRGNAVVLNDALSLNGFLDVGFLFNLFECIKKEPRLNKDIFFSQKLCWKSLRREKKDELVLCNTFNYLYSE